MKITMGMTTWTEHPVLIHDEQRPVRLDEYAQHFPVVEVDTFFYALPQISTIQNWLATVPPTFQFIVKANQKMTLHQRNQERGELEQVFQQYRRIISPLVAAGQLKMEPERSENGCCGATMRRLLPWTTAWGACWTD